MNITNRIHNSYLMTKLARQLVGRDLAQAQAREKNAPIPATKPARQVVGRDLTQRANNAAIPVTKFVGDGPIGAFAKGVTSMFGGPSDDMMDYQIEKATQPDPQYLQRANQKGVLGKYYDDKVKQDYAINPRYGDTGSAARAIIVPEQSKVGITPDVQTPVQPRPQISDADLRARFKREHKTSYDDKSSKDKGKMDILRKKLMGG